ncbi:LuxR C-terminal-related transcriptional regulator [Nocardia sp. NPDC059195]|uniref:LuxR C-terminal-related transcriptional regulator n=1 Tax=Nocardia sp. NPDC059195 TaxID=3346765 RepID=UPI0036A61D44
MGVVDILLRARKAYERREWVAAYESLSGLAPAELDDAALEADDFARLATAAYLTGRDNDCIQALQRAFQLNVTAGDTPAAVRCSFWLALVLISNGETAVGGGWVARGQRLLADIPEDVVERGYLLIHEMMRHVMAAEFSSASQRAVEIVGYGHRYDDPDLIAMGLAAQGRISLYTGDVRQGLALFDEAMVGIAVGAVSPIFAGQVYCTMIEGCQEASDLGRAAEWTIALTNWCDAQPGLVPFTGQCAVHRGQIMRLHGAFDEAIEEFTRAIRRYVAAGTTSAAGFASAERGKVLHIRGDFDAAQSAYDAAIGYGYEPQPELALLWLARGRTSAAVAAMDRLLAEPRDPVHRSQLLPAAVEIMVAAENFDRAVELDAELSTLAAAFGCEALLAMADYAAGHVALVGDRPAEAIPELRRAARLWHTLDAPYEGARCAALIGRALRVLGDNDSAAGELDTARRTLTTLGARPACREIAALAPTPLPRGLSAREVEVLRLVAVGKTNHEIATALFLSEKTIARHLSNIFVKIEVTSRTAAAAFAYEHQLADQH